MIVPSQRKHSTKVSLLVTSSDDTSSGDRHEACRRYDECITGYRHQGQGWCPKGCSQRVDVEPAKATDFMHGRSLWDNVVT